MRYFSRNAFASSALFALVLCTGCFAEEPVEPSDFTPSEKYAGPCRILFDEFTPGISSETVFEYGDDGCVLSSSNHEYRSDYDDYVRWD